MASGGSRGRCVSARVRQAGRGDAPTRSSGSWGSPRDRLPLAAGVHPATACRWLATDAALAQQLQDARQAAARDRRAKAEKPAAPPTASTPHFRKPTVPVHSGCPSCGSASEVRRAWQCFAFWRCSDWPRCSWASWRPRHPADCPDCQGPRFWSWSRKSIGCPRCKTRWRVLWA